MGHERGNRRLRGMDRYLGIPVLALAGAIRRRRRLPERITRIGVIKLTAIGDTVLLAGVLADISAAFPDAELIFFVGHENAGIAQLIDGPTRVVVVPATRPAAAIALIRRHHLDVVVDAGPWTRLEALCAVTAGAKFSVGFRTAGQSRHHGQDVSVEHSNRRHELDNYRNLAAALGVASRSSPRLRPRKLLADSELPSRPYVVFHPWPSGVRSDLKEWPAERWAELATRLADAGQSIVLFGAPADVEASQALAVRLGVPVVDLAGRYGLAEALDVLDASQCVISVNTGIMHVAAAVGAPTVGLNGPTAELRWGPIGPRAVSVNSAFDGCGYLNLGGEYDGERTDCMLGVDVDRVAAAALDLVGRSADRPSW